MFNIALVQRLMDFVNPSWRIGNASIDITPTWIAYGDIAPIQTKPSRPPMLTYDDAKRLAEEDAERQAAWL